MSSPPPKAITRAELRKQYGYSKRTFSRILKRVGITHRRTWLTPGEVESCFQYLARAI